MTDNHDDPVEGTVGLDPAGTLNDQCAHPLPDRRLFDGEVVCSVCWEVLGGPVPAIVPRDRPGTADPTRREGDERSGGLRFVALPTDGQTRPYTPDQVEQEIVLLLDRLERGQGWLTTKEEERAAASLAYDLAFARALINSTARSKEVREAEAMLACREEYERKQLLELTCRTARDGLHSLRSSLSALQSVLKSINATMGAYR
jgi:hypothetical protein